MERTKTLGFEALTLPTGELAVIRVWPLDPGERLPPPPSGGMLELH